MKTPRIANMPLFALSEYAPLTESLELVLGRFYLEERGSAAFINETTPVPWSIHNSGLHASLFSELLYAHIQGLCGEQIALAEFGPGVGLFASQVLDALKDRTGNEVGGAYDRTRYYLFDTSEKMLLDMSRRGIFKDHLGRYRRMVGDARLAGKVTREALNKDRTVGATAIVLNYLLDCLPAMVLRRAPQGPECLVSRTVLNRNGGLDAYTELLPSELADLARARSSDSLRALSRAFPALASEYAFVPIGPSEIPYSEFALQQLEQCPDIFLHSYGALECIEGLLDVCAPGGFIFASDYGRDDQNESMSDFQHQRYTGSTFVMVNFAAIDAYLRERDVQVINPSDEKDGIKVRLYGRSIPQETQDVFRREFDGARGRRASIYRQKAYEAAARNELEVAWRSLRAALQETPQSWTLANDISHFLSSRFGEHLQALEFSKIAIERACQTASSPWVQWGCVQLALGRLSPATQAFRQALLIHPSDPLAHLNLARVYVRRKRFTEALLAIANGLVCDTSGSERQNLLALQDEVIKAISATTDQERFLAQNRIVWADKS